MPEARVCGKLNTIKEVEQDIFTVKYDVTISSLRYYMYLPLYYHADVLVASKLKIFIHTEYQTEDQNWLEKSSNHKYLFLLRVMAW